MRGTKVVLVMLLFVFGRPGFAGSPIADGPHPVSLSEWQVIAVGESRSIPPGLTRYGSFELNMTADVRVQYDIDGRVDLYLMTKAQADRSEDHDPVEPGRDFIRRNRAVEVGGWFIEEGLPAGQYDFVVHNTSGGPVQSSFQIAAQRAR